MKEKLQERVIAGRGGTVEGMLRCSVFGVNLVSRYKPWVLNIESRHDTERTGGHTHVGAFVHKYFAYLRQQSAMTQRTKSRDGRELTETSPLDAA